MLVMTRRWNERVFFIHDGVVLGYLTVVGVDERRVRLGFDFDLKINIVREEIMKASTEPKQEAS